MQSQLEPRPAEATLSVTEAAGLLGVHPNTIRTWSAQGRLRHYRINARGDRRYRLADLRTFLAESERGASSPADPRAREAATPPHQGASAYAPRFLTRIAQLAAAGGSLDARLEGVVAVVEAATDASDVVVWQLRDGDIRRVASRFERPPADRVVPDVVIKSLGQRRTAVAATGAPEIGSDADGTMPVDIAVPIEADRPWGVIAIRTGAGQADHETVEFLECAASLIATMARHDELIDQAAREAQRGEALRRIAMDTNGALELDETLGQVMDHAMALFGADRGAVFVRRGAGDVEAATSRGLSAGYLEVVRPFPTPSLPAQAAAERRPLFATGYGDDPRASAIRAAVVEEGFDTICAAPLIDGDDTIGMLNLYHDRPRRWTADDLETVAAFASQTTVAIRAAQQYTQLARWAAQLESIHQLGARLNRLATVPEMADAIAVELRLLLAYDNIRVYRMRGDTLEAVALHAVDPAYQGETPEIVRCGPGEGIAGWVAAHGIAQNVPDALADPRVADVPESPQGESMLVAPLIFEDRVLGVITLISRGRNRFSADDLRVLEIYASIAAQSMANADAAQRLQAQSEALQHQIRSQRELLEITDSILSAADPGHLFARIASQLGRVVRFDALSIDRYDRRLARLVATPVAASDTDRAVASADLDDLKQWVIRHDKARAVGGCIALPLRDGLGPVAVLTICRDADSDPFTADEIDLVLLFGEQVSVALRHARSRRAPTRSRAAAP